MGNGTKSTTLTYQGHTIFDKASVETQIRKQLIKKSSAVEKENVTT